MGTESGRPTSVLEHQRLAVERLKANLFGNDPYVRRRYILDFHQEFHTYREPLDREQIFDACERSDVILVGDYHALPSCQYFAAEVLERLGQTSRPVALFLEMVFSRSQRALDDYLAGRIDAGELRRRIQYDRDWGYPWDGYGRLLDVARRTGAAAIAADAPPRGGLRLIRRRDQHAAAKIITRLESEPASRALVLYGESHMASRHLPHEVHLEMARRGIERRQIVVVQNVEEIYWALARAGEENVEAVRIDDSRFCVFNASPLAKYEAYRQTLQFWSQQEDESPDFGPSVHHTVDLLVGYLGLNPYSTLVPHRAEGAVPLVDLYPEVTTRRERRRSRARARGARTRRTSIVYRPATNRIDVYSFSLAAAGEAASRFLLAALRGEAGGAGEATGRRNWPAPGEGSLRRRWRGRGSPRRSESRSLRTILDEAFVAFAVRYLDPGVAGRREEGKERAKAAGAASVPANPGAVVAWLARGSKTWGEPDARLRKQTAAWIGAQLGETLYARLRKAKAGASLRRWLLAVARLTEGAEGELASRARALLGTAARHAGWSGKGKRGR